MVKISDFYDKIKENRKNARFNSVSMDKVKYIKLINKVKSAKDKNTRDSNKHKFLKRFDILEANGISKLISPITSSNIQYFVYDEKLYDVLTDAHMKTDHGGRDRMINYLRNKYTNITYRDVQIYVNLCELCQQKQKNKQEKQKTKINKNIVNVNPMLFKELNSKCHIDLIDFRAKPDCDYRFILNYQDFMTKFIILKPLKTNSPEEVCKNIIEIFTLFGAPSVLLSNNGKEYVGKIMDSLRNYWPNFKIIYDNSNSSQECVKKDIENMITNWMKKNNTSSWSEGLQFIQFTKNSEFHNDLRKCPYEAMFGCLPKNGLVSVNIKQETFDLIQSEEELINVIENSHVADEDSNALNT